jgi:drug/metabolite transporter (DMT)-like permease
MIRPGFGTLTPGHGLACAAALFSSLGFIVLRRIGPTEKSAPILFMLFGMIALATAPAALADFVWPTWWQLSILALGGLLQGAGQTGLVLATREAPAALVAPFQYSQMLWAIVFGVVLFGDLPAPAMFVGLALVVGSGLYTIWREAVRRQPVTMAVGRGEVPARAARQAGTALH